ncbi:hypothetical protein [Symbioplanes lichenis]|uniref:hypothetical protein n=1 Tax=Symbioplanes lichenis TaxID=1629072 RepID=UPI002739AEF2|nr:hypothetical protein [Actinoplanes lichenis]
MSDISDEARKELDELAKQRVEDLPGETALGNKDPEAGGDGEPADWTGNKDVQLP